MNDINTNTTAAFNRLAPRFVVLNGRRYIRKGGLYDDATDTVRFDYVAPRKQRGAFIADKVVIVVKYQAGIDYYDVKVVGFNGLSLETVDLVDLCGVEWSLFADVGEWVARS